ncbi:MAG: class I adenylate-forming enzyme family protein, partial [Geobacteraceae bacterium]|nr:class I adenylate-forming enzyme family protein [Geobacteraceae bacterium]
PNTNRLIGTGGISSGTGSLRKCFDSDVILNTVFAHTETVWADKAGLAYGVNNLAFGTLCSMARAISRLLMHYGAKPGDRIAVLSKDPLECLTTFWGVTLIGAIFVPLNPSSGHETLRYIINQSVPTLLFYNSSEQTLINSLCTSVNQTKCIVAAELLREYSSDQNCHQRTAPLPSPDTPAVILYTHCYACGFVQSARPSLT